MMWFRVPLLLVIFYEEAFSMSFIQRIKDKITKQTDSVTEKFKQGLAKTRTSFSGAVNDLVKRYRKVNEEFFEELEEILISADVGVVTVMDLVEILKDEAREKNIQDPVELKSVITEKLAEFLHGNDNQDLNLQQDEMTIILVVGVNGVGKTTTIGKLAYQFTNEGKKVVLAAGHTFRAGAIQQLEVWVERIGADVVKHQEGSDPAAVIFDAIQSARSKKADVLICDTAGRLQNKVNLMKELEKVRKVIAREVPNAPHEVLLVLDATTGQNALNQAKVFNEATNVTGIALTKLDGTAKGGIVLAIQHELNIPVKLIGLGEQMEDLQPFDADTFVYSLFSDLLEEES